MAQMIGETIQDGLLSPLVALLAFLFGWVVRRWWLVPPGAGVIAAASLALSIWELDWPEGSEIVWAATPAGIVPPLAWCIAGFLFGRWRRARHGGSETPGVIRGAWILAGLVLGGAIGTVAGLGLGGAYVALAQVSSFEGQAGYLVVFLFMFPGAVLGAIGGAVVGGVAGRRWMSRRAAAA